MQRNQVSKCRKTRDYINHINHIGAMHMATADPTKVTTRILDWAALVKRAWGPEWSEPDIAYEFSNSRKFKSSDGNNGGIYDPDR